jgi:hypothetical protein
MMKFIIEQVAIAPKDPAKAIAFLKKIGAEEWFSDHVVARGLVARLPSANEADLEFNYQLLHLSREFEVLHYTAGPNWMENNPPSVSHFGMHCTAEELEGWRAFMAAEGIAVAQEVKTDSHTNPAIAGQRWYQYVIFDTRELLGVDLKFIVRLAQRPA